MRDVLFAQLRHKPGRMIATLIAIAISTIFVVLTLTFGNGMKASVRNSIAAATKEADLIATCEPFNVALSLTGKDEPDAEDIDSACETAANNIAGIDVVRATGVYENGVVELKKGAKEIQMFYGTTLPAELEFREFTSGGTPTGDFEIALADFAADELDAKVGDTVVVPGVRLGTEAPHDVELTVTGIVKSLGGLHDGGIVPQNADQWSFPWGVGTNIFIKTDGTDAAKAKTIIQDAHPAGSSPDALRLQTSDEFIEEAMKDFNDGADVLTGVIGVFAALAVVVAGIVIALTFQVLVVQRTRELAMLRCIGATTKQVKRLVLGEAIFIGLISSIVGAIIALIIALVVMPHLNVTPEVSMLAIPMLVGIAVGMVVTLISAWGPSRKATKVAPLEALRPAELTSIRDRAGKIRTGFSIVLIIVGLAMLIIGLQKGELLLAMPGGMILFVGVLLVMAVICPALIRALGRLVGNSAPAELAVSNLARNPRRTASTVMALTLGIGLVTTVAVGKTSVESGLLEEMKDARPIDVVVFAEAITPAQVAKIDRVEHVTDVYVTKGLRAKLAEAEFDSEMPTTILAFDPAVNDHIRGTISEVAPGKCLSAEYDADTALTFTTPAGTELSCHTVVHRGITDNTVWMNTQDLQDIQLQDVAALVHIDDTLAPREFTTLINQIQEISPDFTVVGQASDRVTYTYILTNMMYFILGLLAASVVIAIVGVSNTLSLSVMERRQESGLLRALGFTRGNMKWMLTWEAFLITTAALIVGIGVGLFEAWAGARVVGKSMEVAMPLAIPWLWIISIIAVAFLAAILASRMPARRAAKTSPVAALVAD